MNGDLLVNNLAGLLVVTSLMVIGVRKPKAAAILYSLQSLVLVGTFLVIADVAHAHSLKEWAVSAFITKVVLLPGLLYWAFGKMQDPVSEKPEIKFVWVAVAAVAIVIASFEAVQSVQLPLLAGLKPALAVSLGHFFMGLLCIVSQRNILKQAFGYCLMENGSSLTLALLANKAPGLMEIGVTTDAVFAVIIMVVLARLIYSKLNTLDVRQLTAMKG